MNTLKNNLKALLAQEHLSENELARRTGISQQIINRMLSGANTNPKIGTLSPLAQYFSLSISELIGETEYFMQDLARTPFIDWRLLDQFTHHGQQLHNAPNHTFETCLRDPSMEPKFYSGSRLIFDLSKTPVSGDFVLLASHNASIVLRQFFIRKNTASSKCLNPSHPDYNLSQLPRDARCFATLLQVRSHQQPVLESPYSQL